MNQLTVCLIIFTCTVISYCLGKISLATTAMASTSLLMLTGCLAPKEALSNFGNSTIVMIGAMTVIAQGFSRTSFCRVIAKKIADLSSGSLTRMMAGYVFITLLLAQMLPSAIVVLTIMAPMLINSAEAIGVKPSKVMFSLGATSICTINTLPLGGGATVPSEMNAQLESFGYTAFEVGYLDHMFGRLPVIIAVALMCIFVIPRFSPDAPIVPTSFDMKKSSAKEPLRPFAERAGVLIFFGDSLALIFSGQLGVSTWQIALIGAVLMVLCGVMKSKEASSAIPVSMLLLISGALNMSNALANTGAGELLGDLVSNIVAALNGNGYLVGLMFFLVAFALTQFMSNRGAQLIFNPIAIATCASLGVNPTGLMILIRAACLAAFMTPMATASVPYIMGYGGYDQKSMIRMSIPLAIVICVISVFWIMTVFPL